MQNYLTDLIYTDECYASRTTIKKSLAGVNRTKTSLDTFYATATDTDTDTEAYQSLPPVIQQALMQQQRVVLIANNPSITIETLEQTLQPTDVVVLFNHFIHAEFFASHPLAKRLPKLLFFRQIGDSKLHFGMPPRSNHLPAIKQMIKHSALGLLFSNVAYQYPLAADDPSPNDDPITSARELTVSSALTQLLANPEHCQVLSEHHSAVADYPSFADIHSSAPTSGFLLYRVLLAARNSLKREQANNQSSALSESLSILMLGFNDEDKTAHFWEGHNWDFERQELIDPPAGVEIIRQY